MTFDKDAYWKKRNAEKARIEAGLPPAKKKPEGRRYTVFEVQAMQYHKRVMKAVQRGDITEEQGRAELLDASKAAAENLSKTGAPEIVSTVVEQLIIYGSYEAVLKAAEKEKTNAGKSK